MATRNEMIQHDRKTCNVNDRDNIGHFLCTTTIKNIESRSFAVIVTYMGQRVRLDNFYEIFSIIDLSIVVLISNYRSFIIL